jgi:hypothetical protein
MVVNGVIKKGFACVSIVLQEEVNAHWILFHGSDDDIETAPLILVHPLVRLVPPILFYGGIVI